MTKWLSGVTMGGLGIAWDFCEGGFLLKDVTEMPLADYSSFWRYSPIRRKVITCGPSVLRGENFGMRSMSGGVS